MSMSSALRRAVVPAAVLVAAGSLAFSLLLVFGHIRVIHAFRRDVVPAMLRLPEAQKTLHILRDHIEIAEVEQAVRGGSVRESLEAFVLPSESERDRLLALIDVVTDWMRREGLLFSLSPITVGEDRADPALDGVVASPVSFDAQVSEEGRVFLLTFLDLTGLLTVSDALTDEQRGLLFQRIEEENPAAITSLEHFLAADLLRYAREPQPVERILLKSFSREDMDETLQAFTRDSRLQDAQHLLGGGLGKTLEAQNLWPMRFLSVDSVEIADTENGRIAIALRLSALMRR